MAYRLEFHPKAKKELDKLGRQLQAQFLKKLAERLEAPRVAADALHGLPDCYKIKLRSSGYRMVYQVNDGLVLVLVLAVGKRELGQGIAFLSSNGDCDHEARPFFSG